MTSPPAREGAHAQLLHALGGTIAAGRLEPGAVLTLARLGRDYGVSRTTAREAVRVLESLSMVQSRRRVGITVLPRADWRVLDVQLIRWTLAGPLHRQQLVELMELRAALEPAAAALAAVRASDAQRVALVEHATELHRLGSAARGDSAEYLAADIRFHTLLLVASGNVLYGELAAPVREILQGRHELGLTPAVPAAGTLDAHLAAARAIAAGEGGAAREHSRTHLSLVSDEVEGA